MQKFQAHISDTQKIYFVTPVFTGAQGRWVLIRLVLQFSAAKQLEGSRGLMCPSALIKKTSETFNMLSITSIICTSHENPVQIAAM